MKRTTLFYFCLITLLTHNYTHNMDLPLLDEKEQFVASVNRVLMPEVQDEATQRAITKITDLYFQKPKKSSEKPAVKSITFFKTSSCPTIITELPSDINGIIFDMVISTRTKKLSKTAKRINSLVPLCRSMNKFINNSKNTLALIKNLSWVFNSSHEIVAETLQTKGARKRLAVQIAFASICSGNRYTSISPKKSLMLQANDTDVNFTYGSDAETQLIKACQREEKPFIIKWLLEQNADYSISNKETDPAVFNLVNTYTPLASEALGYFLKSPHFNINYSYKGKNNTSITLLFYFLTKSFDRLLEKNLLEISQLQVLLNYGANPEIPGPGGMTPLMLVKMGADIFKDHEIVKMLENAVAKKHGIHKTLSTKNKTRNKRHHKKYTHSKKKS